METNFMNSGKNKTSELNRFIVNLTNNCKTTELVQLQVQKSM